MALFIRYSGGKKIFNMSAVADIDMSAEEVVGINLVTGQSRVLTGLDAKNFRYWIDKICTDPLVLNLDAVVEKHQNSQPQLVKKVKIK